MKISPILDHIDSGHMALSEFQRGYRCFTSIAIFREYIEKDILTLEQGA